MTRAYKNVKPQLIVYIWTEGDRKWEFHTEILAEVDVLTQKELKHCKVWLMDRTFLKLEKSEQQIRRVFVYCLTLKCNGERDSENGTWTNTPVTHAGKIQGHKLEPWKDFHKRSRWNRHGWMDEYKHGLQRDRCWLPSAEGGGKRESPQLCWTIIVSVKIQISGSAESSNLALRERWQTEAQGPQVARWTI